ncbi:MAG TPA: uroporphyrinogen-III synthase [Alphaproteobacteria bacterium]|nr:uroporphyrinogen-III synthase [Alphaproteobacteria bacterium]HOO50284.1 uroporphyrinogen-III synthase [Alphaproteobacteria bacterium]
MSKKVLVTRPMEQARAFADQVRLLGAEPILCPLLTIEILPVSFPSELPDALVVTSSQVFSVLENRKSELSRYFSIPVYCVGDATSFRAKEFGFSQVINARGTVSDLMALLARDLPKGRVAYWRGYDVSVDLVSSYPDYQWDELVVYQAREGAEWSREFRDHFSSLFAVTLFSRRSGEIFAQKIKEYGLEEELLTINLLCLSPQVLDSVSSFDWKRCYVADQPDRAQIIKSLASLLREIK